MGSPLEIISRKGGAEYHTQPLNGLGGWNPDASDTTLPPTDFSECRNFRQATYGELEVRSGVRVFHIPSSAGGQVLSTSEYRSDLAGTDNLYVAVLATAPGPLAGQTQVLLYFYDPIANAVHSTAVVDTLTNAQVVGLLGWTEQFGLSMIVTLKGISTYEVAPADTALASWNVTKLGKDVCPTPNSVAFVETTDGDLLVFDNNGSDSSRGPLGDNLPTQFRYDANDPIPSIIRVPIGATYWRSDTGKFAVNKPKQWVFNVTDVKATPPEDSPETFEHNRCNGFGYRAVAVQEFTNAKGETYRVRSEPSADFWVQDTIYCPAQLGPQPDNYPAWAAAAEWLPLPYTSFDANGNAINALPLPTKADYDTLVKLYRTYSKDNGQDPYFYLAWYFGYVRNGGGPSFGGKTPYWTEAPASVLKGAPMTIFKWADFTLAGLTGTIVEIELYRTAHSEANEKDNTKKSPLFAEHKFGYVGSITPTSDFTDDVPDENIDFGTVPEHYSGYLRGQFSGSVLREYHNQLAIGDVATDLTVLKPTTLAQSFWYDVSDKAPATYYDGTWFGVAPDARPYAEWFYAYVDVNGVQSDAAQVPPFAYSHVPPAGGKQWISFVFPRGYDATITRIRIWRAKYDTATGVRTYYLVAEIPISQQVYISQNNEAATVVQASALVGGIKRSTSPWAVISSKPNQPEWWAPEDVERVHQFAPVTRLEVLLGQLWAFTDQSIKLTELNGRAEEETHYVGCLSRFGAVKVDKYIVMMSQFGVYIVDPSGVKAFPAHVQSVVLQYINEQIPGQAALANVRRTSIGFLAERNEIVIYFPSSVDLWADADKALALPQMMIVYKLGSGNSPQEVINYQFDLTQDFEVKDFFQLGNPAYDDTSTYRSDRPVFQNGSRGGLWSAFHDAISNDIVILDNDYIGKDATDWQGSEALEKREHMGRPNLKKTLREIVIRVSGKAQVRIGTGQPTQDGTKSRLRGALHTSARLFLAALNKTPLRHTISGPTIETTSYAPVIRIIGGPDKDGNNSLHIKAIDVTMEAVNVHP